MSKLHKITYIFSLCSLSLLGQINLKQQSQKQQVNQAYYFKNDLLSNNIKTTHRKYKVYKGQIKTSTQSQAINTSYEYYQYTGNRKTLTPLVIIFTGVGGVSFVERKIARFFVHRKISAVIIEFKNFEDIQTITRFSQKIKGSLLSSLGVLEYFCNQPEIDENKIATIGISLGGFRALYLSSLDKRIKATTLVVTGASICDSIARSKLSLARRIRHLHMGSLETKSHSTYSDELKKHLQLQQLQTRTQEHYYLFMAKRDKTVPYDQQYNLWKNLGEPKSYTNNGNHLMCILYYICNGLKNTLNFFNNRWNCK